MYPCQNTTSAVISLKLKGHLLAVNKVARTAVTLYSVGEISGGKCTLLLLLVYCHGVCCVEPSSMRKTTVIGFWGN